MAMLKGERALELREQTNPAARQVTFLNSRMKTPFVPALRFKVRINQ